MDSSVATPLHGELLMAQAEMCMLCCGYMYASWTGRLTECRSRV